MLTLTTKNPPPHFQKLTPIKSIGEVYLSKLASLKVTEREVKALNSDNYNDQKIVGMSRNN